MSLVKNEELAALLPYLTAQELAEIDYLLATDPLIWRPLPGPQSNAYYSEADELFYGGAAGGGKSDLILGLSLTTHTKSIIFRREYPQLKDIIDRSCEIIGHRRGFNGQANTWRLPNRSIEFGAVQYDTDVNKYQGRAHDLKCVAAETPVRLADNTYRPIKNIRVGDMVATLEGPRKVTRVLKMGKRKAVKAKTVINGREFTQIQSQNHAVLTAVGWVSYDKLCESRLSLTSVPILRHAVRKSLKWSSLPYGAIFPYLLGLCLDREQQRELFQCLLGYQYLSGLFFDMVLPNLEICYAMSDGERLNVLPPVLCRRDLSALFRPFQQWPEKDSLPPVFLRDKKDVRSYPLQQDYLDYCSFDIHLYDEQLRCVEVTGLVYPQQLDDAEERTPIDFGEDDQGETPRHNHCIRQYDHPYTKENRQTSVDMRTSSFSFTPVGEQELFDLTVESVNHYITGAAGIINKNCFDELPNFTEFQYRFLIGWNRTTKVGQRVRVVGAGNPPTNADGEWVIRRWAPWLDNQHPRPAKPGELRWFAMLDGEDTEVESGKPFTHKGEEIKPKSRTFIPAKLSDNPYLMATDYAATLQAMPEPLRTQLLKGDFHVSLEDNPWQVIPTMWVELAQAKWRQRSKPNVLLSALGADIARGGKDKTVIAPRYANWFDELRKYPGTMTPDGDSAAIYVAQAHKDGAVVNMDIIGVGTAAYDATIKLGIAVNGVNFAEGSELTDKSGKFKFVNKRAEAYWKFREALDPKTGDDIALPPDPELKADLCAPRWKLTARGIQVESKEDIIERLKRSPDSGDAVVLSHILAPLIVPFVQGKAQGWNPR